MKYGIVFDDTPMYEGQRAYGPGIDIEIRPPDAARLKAVDAVIIAAYLHDVVINRKLQNFAFPGVVYTVRADALSGVGGAPPACSKHDFATGARRLQITPSISVPPLFTM